MPKEMTEEELANLSDEDLMNMATPPTMAQEDPASGGEGNDEGSGNDGDTAAAAEQGNQGDEAGNAGDDDPDDDPADAAAGDDEEDSVGDDPGSADASDTSDDPDLESGEAAPEGEGEAEDDPASDKGVDKPKGDDEGKETSGEEVDYKAAYERIMAPFKAAGKTVQLNSPDDVIQLMQMGAHYTKKMQALQPNLKLLKMLENNDLLDEGKLSYLIDVSRKDPGAIQKLVRDSGIDPVDIDTSVEPEYKPGNYRVPDEEIAFTNTLEEVSSDPEGKELIVSINKTWDKPSKEALWSDPSILKVLAEQKQNGIYDQIASEIERRRTLGYLGNAPFLQVYKTIGEELQAAGQLAPKQADPNSAPTSQGGQPNQERRVVETRPAQRKPAQNHEKAKAASPTKAAPRKKAAAEFNPLAMSDEEFEKSADLANKL